MLQFRFGIRLKLLLLSSFLFTIPWLGYQYVWEMENYLRLGQEQTLMGTARAVATALHERPTLFDKQASYLQNVKPGTDLYAHKIYDAIQLDGRLRDWDDYQHLAVDYKADYLLQDAPWYQESDISFRHMVGIYGIYLYAFFEVTDNQTVLRSNNSLRVDRNDYLHIALTDRDDHFHRYIVATQESGWVNAYELNAIPESYRPLGIESRIQGHWEVTDKGYNIELRMPLAMVSDKIAFEIADVDDLQTRQINLRIGTANPEEVDSLGTVLVPSPEIERIVKGLEHSDARVWVLDKHKRVMARSGSILASTGINSDSLSYGDNLDWWQKIETQLLLPLYYQILTKPPAEFVDELLDAFALKGSDIESALTGTPDTLWRLTPDNKAVVLSAAHPIWLDDVVMGAVVVEQTTHGIRTLRNKALEKLFNVILAVMGLGTLALFLFASRISFRIRKLRNQTEAAIDQHGKIVSNVPASRTQDEIGDLSRSFHNVLEKLQQYHSYLENMASRLSHELRTPVAVVKSSMENLVLDSPEHADNPYINRAQEGIKRLSLILSNMSEASRLEHALRTAEPESFDLVELIQGVCHGYKLAYADRNFTHNIELETLLMSGSPDLFVQMLDKITSNAVEFSVDNSDISFHLARKQNATQLTISNTGELLPEALQSQLFDSMISVRENQQSDVPHLGLGLFIARIIAEFHNGSISIQNNSEQSGVNVIIVFKDV